MVAHFTTDGCDLVAIVGQHLVQPSCRASEPDEYDCGTQFFTLWDEKLLENIDFVVEVCTVDAVLLYFVQGQLFSWNKHLQHNKTKEMIILVCQPGHSSIS